MKKLLLLVLITLSISSSFAQKKKKTVAKALSANILSKIDNLTVEFSKNNLLLFANSGKLKDTISIKSTEYPISDCKISSFTAKGNKLYLMTWNEKATTQTATKTEEKTFANSEIYDVASKTKVFANIQTATKIKEQVFLDRLKNASETQERMRNEGFVVTLLPDGELSLKTKTQENKMTYDVAAKKYVDVKKKK